MESEMVPLIVLFAVGIPLSVPIVWIVLNYRKRRRFMELHHAERMAAIERGMDVPPLPTDLIDDRGGTRRRRRSSLLPGLVWFFIGLAMVIGITEGRVGDDDFPLMFGLIPLGIGLAYLVYYFAEGRKVEARLLEHDLAEKSNGTSNRPDPRAPGNL